MWVCVIHLGPGPWWPATYPVSKGSELTGTQSLGKGVTKHTTHTPSLFAQEGIVTTCIRGKIQIFSLARIRLTVSQESIRADTTKLFGQCVHVSMWKELQTYESVSINLFLHKMKYGALFTSSTLYRTSTSQIYT